MLEALQVPLNDEQRAAVEGLKERTGADEAAILRFYDAASLRLVAKREAFINQLFGYGPPSDEARALARAAKKSSDQPAEGPKLSKAEKEQKRQARAERQAAKEARKAAGGAKKGGATKAEDQQPQNKAEKKADRPAAAAKPEKLKRVKNKPLDEDVVDSEE